MIFHVRLSALHQTNRREYVIRFLLGGFATAIAGLIAQLKGPAWGGLFLAFPAVFCASATLIEGHERSRKERLGLAGVRRGISAAALDAAGTALGSFGLMAFATIVWLFTQRSPLLALIGASVTWVIVGLLMWAARQWLVIPLLANRRQTRA